MTMRALAFAAIACALWPAPVHAGPCAEDLYKAEVDVGKRLDQSRRPARPARNRPSPPRHHQPTPATIAGAEGKVGDISRPR